MNFLGFNLRLTCMLFLLVCTSNSRMIHDVDQKGVIAKIIIIVDQSGKGNFTSVQKAIDSIPPNNNLWTHIYIKTAIYNEKVVIPKDKPFIILQGESARRTIIQWQEAGSSTESSTFILHADNFIAKDLLIRNTYNLVLPRSSNGNRILWAPAATLYSDKASFYRCGFVGVQDTLTDLQGRHYFNNCYIEGAIDFIWGAGQSVYGKCVINATTGILQGPAGHITAQGRRNENDSSGYIFLGATIYATGPFYLGRAYTQFSRVIFKRTYIPQAIVPEGWQPWNSAGHENTIIFSEVSCSGPGSNTHERVKWEKNLALNELNKLIINRDDFFYKVSKSIIIGVIFSLPYTITIHFKSNCSDGLTHRNMCGVSKRHPGPFSNQHIRKISRIAREIDLESSRICMRV
ncbi:probable pectinesterase 29 [Mercurialis annua]|uniref:probable pectinesterase 29 n=1 Tax=Mercurialis annua TaxID=3986 RepID=UPI00215E4504|nr:probable pectinesterase 29 [Mercurialis annua]